MDRAQQCVSSRAVLPCDNDDRRRDDRANSETNWCHSCRKGWGGKTCTYQLACSACELRLAASRCAKAAAQKPLHLNPPVRSPLVPQLKGKKHVVCVLIRPGYRRSNDSGMFVRGPCVRSYTAPDSIKYVLCSYTASVQPLHRPCCSWRLRTNHSVKAHRS